MEKTDLERYKRAFDEARVAMVFADENSRIFEVNEEFCRFLGYSKEELLGKTIGEITYPEDRKLTTESLNKLHSGQEHTITIEKRYITKDGRVVWGLVNPTNIFEHDGKPITFTVLRDITEKKRLAESLSKSERAYEQLVELSPDAIVVHSGGKLVYVNDSAVKVIGGRSKRDLIGRELRNFILDKDWEMVMQRVKTMLDTKQPAPLIDAQLYRLDKKIIDVQVISRPMIYQGQPSIQAILHDVTEKERMTKELRKSETMYRALAEASNDMIFVIMPDGKIDYANTYAARSFGTTPEQMVGKNKTEFFGKEISERQDRSLAKVYETGKPYYTDNLTSFGKREIWLSTWLVPLKDDNDKVVKVMGVSRDITSIKEVEKMRDDFFVIASHELRAPMTAIKWLVQMMQNGQYGKLDERMIDPLVNVENSTERLIRLVNDLISAARIETSDVQLKLSVFDIMQVVHEVVQTFTPWAKNKNIDLDVADVGSVMVYADRDKVIQIINNLIDNAIKFTPDKGKITLKTEVRDSELCVEISDTGIGIPEEAKKKLFGKFSQISTSLENRPQGTGLGLFISREFAQVMGGDLKLVRTEVSKGSSFIFSLPLKKD